MNLKSHPVDSAQGAYFACGGNALLLKRGSVGKPDKRALRKRISNLLIP